MTWPRAGLLLAWLLLALQTLPANWSTPLEIDEQITYYLAAGRTPNSVWRRCQEQAATPPLHFWLTKACLALPMGTLEFRLRLPALMATAVGLLFAWRIGERFIGRGAGVMAALLLALNPLVVKQFAWQSRPYALGFLLTLAGLDAVVRLRALDGRRRHLMTFVLCCVALPWTHYLFALTVPALVLAGLLVPGLAGLESPSPRRGRGVGVRGRSPQTSLGEALVDVKGRPFPRRWLLAIGVFAGVAATPLIPGVLRVQSLEQVLRWHTEHPHFNELLGFDFPSDVGLAEASGVTCGLALSASAFRPRSLRLGLALLAALLPALALRLLSILLDSPALSQVRYAAPMLGPLALWLALGIFNLPRKWRWPGFAALVGATLWLNGATLRQRLRQPVWHDAEWQTAAATIAKEAGPHDVAFCYTGVVESRLVPLKFADAGFQEYCTSRLGPAYLPSNLPRWAWPMDAAENVGPTSWREDYAAKARAALAAGGTVWLVVSADTDPGKAAEQAALKLLREVGAEPKLRRDNSIARVWFAAALKP